MNSTADIQAQHLIQSTLLLALSGLQTLIKQDGLSPANTLNLMRILSEMLMSGGPEKWNENTEQFLEKLRGLQELLPGPEILPFVLQDAQQIDKVLEILRLLGTTDHSVSRQVPSELIDVTKNILLDSADLEGTYEIMQFLQKHSLLDVGTLQTIARCAPYIKVMHYVVSYFRFSQDTKQSKKQILAILECFDHPEVLSGQDKNLSENLINLFTALDQNNHLSYKVLISLLKTPSNYTLFVFGPDENLRWVVPNSTLAIRGVLTKSYQLKSLFSLLKTAGVVETKENRQNLLNQVDHAVQMLEVLRLIQLKPQHESLTQYQVPIRALLNKIEKVPSVVGILTCITEKGLVVSCSFLSKLVSYDLNVIQVVLAIVKNLQKAKLLILKNLDIFKVIDIDQLQSINNLLILVTAKGCLDQKVLDVVLFHLQQNLIVKITDKYSESIKDKYNSSEKVIHWLAEGAAIFYLTELKIDSTEIQKIITQNTNNIEHASKILAYLYKWYDDKRLWKVSNPVLIRNIFGTENDTRVLILELFENLQVLLEKVEKGKPTNSLAGFLLSFFESNKVLPCKTAQMKTINTALVCLLKEYNAQPFQLDIQSWLSVVPRLLKRDPKISEQPQPFALFCTQSPQYVCALERILALLQKENFLTTERQTRILDTPPQVIPDIHTALEYLRGYTRDKLLTVSQKNACPPNCLTEDHLETILGSPKTATEQAKAIRAAAIEKNSGKRRAPIRSNSDPTTKRYGVLFVEKQPNRHNSVPTTSTAPAPAPAL